MQLAHSDEFESNTDIITLYVLLLSFYVYKSKLYKLLFNFFEALKQVGHMEMSITVLIKLIFNNEHIKSKSSTFSKIIWIFD